MPDRRRHRGPHPQDRQRFAPEHLPALRQAVSDLAWLLDRGYSERAARKLVGDRFGLDRRQRLALLRATCTTAAAAARAARRVDPGDVAGQRLAIDAFNVLTTVEAALASGVILACRDSAYRDLASVHGTWRRVQETEPALELTGEVLASLEPAECLWLLDRPVSNSGRLQVLIREVAGRHRWPWNARVVDSPDRELSTGESIAATSDSAILDRGVRWLDLPRLVLDRRVPDAWILDLQ